MQNLKMGEYIRGAMEEALLLHLNLGLHHGGIKENLRRTLYECQKAVYRQRVHRKDILQSERMGS